MFDALEARCRSEFFVLLVEECGYRSWFWFPHMTAVELERWWRELETVIPYFRDIESLPGDLVERFREADDALRLRLGPSQEYWQCHVHENCDSYLLRPDLSYIFHKGYKGLDR